MHNRKNHKCLQYASISSIKHLNNVCKLRCKYDCMHLLIINILNRYIVDNSMADDSTANANVNDRVKLSKFKKYIGNVSENSQVSFEYGIKCTRELFDWKLN